MLFAIPLIKFVRLGMDLRIKMRMENKRLFFILSECMLGRLGLTLDHLLVGRSKKNDKKVVRKHLQTDKNIFDFFLIKKYLWASLVAQRLRICLPMQDTRVRALVWEDPTCRGATGPVSHNY